MRIDILTLFPGMFQGPLTESIIDRARGKKLLEIAFHDLRSHGLGQYHQDAVVPAIESIAPTPSPSPEGGGGTHRIYLSPRGKRLTQERVEELSKKDHLLLLCGHYEGVDQRVIDGWIDEEISIGDYVLTGGELPAMVLIDALARQIPGVLGKDESASEESFSPALDRKKEYPHYTRPEEFRGMKVPDVLLSGNHKEIEKWRREQLL